MQRIGVIGLGTIGQTHVAALGTLGAHVVGADPSPVARERVAAFVEQSFEDYREMIARADLDGVVVATPPRTHREIAVAALGAGVAVLCEKPLALTLEDCEVIASAADSTSRPLQVGFCHRFQPEVKALLGLLNSGAIGAPVLVNISFIHGLTEQGREWITDAAQAGGGVLFDSGSHAIDLFRYLVGNVDEVRGMTAGQSVEDSSVACLRSGDVLGTITLSWKTPPWQGLVEVIGSTGRARVRYDGDHVVLSASAGDAPWHVVRTPRMSRFVAQMQHFLACLRGEEAPAASARDGLEATRIILRIYEDQRTALEAV
jgi:predicted dehydrogenase